MELLKKGSRGKAVKMIQQKLHLIDDGIFGRLTEEAVRQYQKEHGLTADGIVGEKTWKSLFADNAEEVETEGSEVTIAGLHIKKSKRKITEIFIHCTATPEGRDMTVSQIRKAHLSKGWSDIGYHYVVYRDGSVHEGRDVDVAGAHVSGRNSHSIGVVYVGGLENISGVPVSKLPAKDTRTDEQRQALKELVAVLRNLYPAAKVLGHRDASPDKDGNGTVEPWEWIKSCPCFDAIKEYN